MREVLCTGTGIARERLAKAIASPGRGGRTGPSRPGAATYPKKNRLGQFGLSLNEEKTRLIEFGRYATERRAERGEGKSETFDFLGFTHISGRSRDNGRFMLKRKTARRRLCAKMKDIRRQLLWHRHKPISEQGAWLRLVQQGYFNSDLIGQLPPAL